MDVGLPCPLLVTQAIGISAVRYLGSATAADRTAVARPTHLMESSSSTHADAPCYLWRRQHPLPKPCVRRRHPRPHLLPSPRPASPPYCLFQHAKCLNRGPPSPRSTPWIHAPPTLQRGLPSSRRSSASPAHPATLLTFVFLHPSMSCCRPSAMPPALPLRHPHPRALPRLSHYQLLASQ